MCDIKKRRYVWNNIPEQHDLIGDDIEDVKDEVISLKNAFKAYINLKKQEDIRERTIFNPSFTQDQIKDYVDKKYKDVDKYLK